MSDNWLETAGSWLKKPFVALVGPWWDSLVQAKAGDAANRLKLLEAIVRFRISDFARLCSVDADRAAGLVVKVADRLRPEVKSNPELDLTSELFLRMVEHEIQIHAVSLTAWIQQACLCDLGNFNPKKYIVVEFTDERGNNTHGTTAICSLNSSFPFSKILTLTNSMEAKLSGDSIVSLRDYCSRLTLPEVTYNIADSMPVFGMTDRTRSRILAKGWKPSE
jgi:hypothetical protein